MATFAIKCPHCLRDNTSFTVVAVKAHGPADGRGWVDCEVFATCNACQKGVSGTVMFRQPFIKADLGNIQLLQNGEHVMLGEWLPKPPVPDVPDHLPDAVRKAFSEAENLRIAGFRGPAGNAYRRALEAGLKEVDASLKGTLYSRIEQLATQALLTPHMRDFAHRIRTLGNEASHETPVVDDDEIDNLAVFTKLFLMYQFMLPGMLPKLEPATLEAAPMAAT